MFSPAQFATMVFVALQEMGCDFVIGSGQKMDKCGKCGGNGESCEYVSGEFSDCCFAFTDLALFLL